MKINKCLSEKCQCCYRKPKGFWDEFNNLILSATENYIILCDECLKQFIQEIKEILTEPICSDCGLEKCVCICVNYDYLEDDN